jgi:hypothetical protein
MNFRTVGELRGGRGDHPSEEAVAKLIMEPNAVLTQPPIDGPELSSVSLGAIDDRNAAISKRATRGPLALSSVSSWPAKPKNGQGGEVRERQSGVSSGLPESRSAR